MGRDLISHSREQAERLFPREEPAVIAAFDEATGSYTVTYKGTTVGTVFSANGVLHEVGASVKVLVESGIVTLVIP